MNREVAASERRYQRYAKGMAHRRNGEVCITEEMDAPYRLERMEAVVRRIASGEGDAIQPATGKGLLTYGHFKNVVTPLGKAILDVCFDSVPLIESLYPGCRRKDRSTAYTPTYIKTDDPFRLDDLKVSFNPFITVMLRACQKATQLLYWSGGKKLNADDPEAIRAFKHLLRFVRRVCRSKKFRRIVNDYNHCARENFRSCCQYMATKFARYSRLLILRVDLYINPEFKVWATTEAAERCIESYLRGVRESHIVPDVKAWISKRENGVRRGIHYHLLVAMDGHKHRQAATYSRLLGEAWERYTEGYGTFFNCWVRRGEYSLNCLGLVRLDDRLMLLGLREAIKYMTKADYQVETGYKRNLRKGITRLSWGEVKRGAPRKVQHDLALVSEILGGA